LSDYRLLLTMNDFIWMIGRVFFYLFSSY